MYLALIDFSYQVKYRSCSKGVAVPSIEVPGTDLSSGNSSCVLIWSTSSNGAEVLAAGDAFLPIDADVEPLFVSKSSLLTWWSILQVFPSLILFVGVERFL